MQNPGKWFVALTILIVIMSIALHFLNHNAPNSSAPDLLPTNSIAKNTFHFQVPSVPRTQPPELDLAGQPKIPREKVEE